MSSEDVRLLQEAMHELGLRMAALETAVADVMTRALCHDKIINWLKMVSILVIGITIGLGIISLKDVVGIWTKE